MRRVLPVHRELGVPRFELPDLCVSRKVFLDLLDQIRIVGEIGYAALEF